MINSPREDAETFETEHCNRAPGDYDFYWVLDLMRNSFLTPLFIFVSGYLNICGVKSLEKAHPLLAQYSGLVGFREGVLWKS